MCRSRYALTCAARCMRVLTATALIDKCGRSLYKTNKISERLAQPGQADGYRLMDEIKNPLKWPFDQSIKQCEMGTSHK